MTAFRIIVLCAAVIITALIVSPRSTLAQASTPVTVSNPGDIAAAQGIQTPLAQAINCQGDVFECRSEFSTPANQRFILEFVAVTCTKPAQAQVTQPVLAIFGSNPREVVALLTVPLNTAEQTSFSSVAGSSPAAVVISQPIKVYVAPNQRVFFNVDAPTGVSCTGSIFGQAVNAP